MNDLVYNEIVATPGFELEFAVGTTYSLDAEIFLALSLSFSRLGDISQADFQNPLRMLEGLRRATDRMAVFCNRGGLRPPERSNPLYAMLDRCVFEVSNRKEPLANFHPKIWIIKERSLEDRSFRQIKLIVLSRNLTKDTSLDVAVSMTAPLGMGTDAATRKKHEPLKRLLEELAGFANQAKKKQIRSLAKDLDSLGPFKLDSQYVDYDFIPIHFGENFNSEIDFREELPGQRMMIVSPFIDPDVTTKYNGQSWDTPVKWMNDFVQLKEKVLVTRLESLTPEIMQLYSSPNREIWVMSQVAEQNDIQPMNLHAKMYFSWGSRHGGVYLWTGSANATHSGFYRNSEFLLRLTLRRGKNQFESFKAEFCDEKKQLCQRVTSLPEGIETSNENHSLSIKVRKILLKPNNLSARVITTEGVQHIIITAKKIKDIPASIKFAPIQEPFNERELSHDTKECIIPVSKSANLSEFYILTVTPREESGGELLKLVVKIPTIGIPEDRDDRIFRSLVDTREKFLNYVEIMITDRPQEQASLILSNSTDKNPGGGLSGPGRSATLYESLLRIAATNPGKLKDIQDVVGRLDADVVPGSFAQMADMFQRSLKKLR